MTAESLQALMERNAEQWRAAIRRWQAVGTIVLFDEVQTILAESVCAWAGVPLAPREVAQRARDLAAMVDAFGGVGPRLWKGKIARARSERWIAGLVEQVRSGKRHAPPGTALHVIAHHRELDGSLLSPRVAAVEILNVVRPTVAIAWYIAFAALALHQHPQARERLVHEQHGENAGEYADLFMQEVRRFYPFTPYLGALVRQPFDWHGQHFARGNMVLLDVYGTNHDPRLWPEPGEFRPERFQQWDGDMFNYIPQGGGSREAGHRCPGEWITMHHVTLALHFLTRCMSYEVVPDQD
jgi:fatty-acid peroxygenase